MKQLKNCQKITQLASLSQEEPLTWSQKITLKFHLMMCPNCKQFDKNNQTLKQIIKKHKEE
ncbi:MAG: zf-HC2 domain-containing protein [Moraxella sp.]|uniref:zf-HC2 domain-containing protein n=1 Tax=Moraxella sp. TaxID=479 RepID=UPI0026DCD606|nr:zf-HC2 domain-containing protein [Moraxella sp.]MDO4450611.1 zf-HC2 domain-containing protein [Moraxella sp.]